jgi:EAL domain-containing protein (putative c-di-GMP-specific phosphodiesterase class I)
MMDFVRAQAGALKRRLAEPRRFIQVVVGPRHTGKTTLVRTVVGVENAAQAQFLAGVRCEHAQGFLYSKPLPPAEFARWLSIAKSARSRVGNELQSSEALV